MSFFSFKSFFNLLHSAVNPLKVLCLLDDSMEFEIIQKHSDIQYTVGISVADNLNLTYNIVNAKSHTTPPTDNVNLNLYISEIAKQFEIYSARWSSAPVYSMHFMKRVQNVWNTASHLPYSGEVETLSVQQIWRPEQIKVSPGLYQIVWELDLVQYIVPNDNGVSGQDAIDEILFSNSDDTIVIEQSLRARARRLIRKFRIMIAHKKLKLSELTLEYYNKYGNDEGNDNESILSSDTEEFKDI